MLASGRYAGLLRLLLLCKSAVEEYVGDARATWQQLDGV